MAHFKQTFRVRAPLSETWALHADPIVLRVLTPPPLRAKILHRDDPLRAGATLKFRLALIGPLGATWHAIYDEYDPYTPGAKQCGFVDRSLSSPFSKWTHRHTFVDVGNGSSTVTDDVTFELVSGPLGGVINRLVAWPAIAFLFLFRRLQTQRMLASGVYRP